MEANKRESARVPMAREVMLKGDYFSPQFCQLRDISAEGAYVDLGLHSLRRGMSVEMSLTIAEADRNRVLRLNAQIARVTEEGAGLRFAELDMPSQSAVLGLVYA